MYRDNELDEFIYHTIGEEASWMQLAEEAAELSQAAAKCARYLHDTNPVEGSLDDLEERVFEEVTDVAVCCNVLGVSPDNDIARGKYIRWRNRLKFGKHHHDNANDED